MISSLRRPALPCKRFPVATLLLIVLLLPACRLQSDVTAIKLGHSLDQQHPVHVAMARMAERVHELSDGKMRIDIYPSSQLGSERETMELLQIGSLGMTKVSSATIEAYSDHFQVFGLPYLFEDNEHRFGVLDSEIGEMILASLDDYNLIGLGYYDAGFRSFYAGRPVNTPEDLRGMKIRVQESPIAMRMVRALGGSPTPISWGELYTALQQGIVDGAENNSPSFQTSMHYEVSRHFTLNEHTAVPDVLIFSKIIWDRLTAQEQAWVQQAADESVDFQRELWQEAEEAAITFVEERGVQVVYPDKEPFRRKVEPLIESYRDHDIIWPLIQQIRNFEPADRQDAAVADAQ